MNDIQKKRLERNLSYSASGAKIYWVRALTGTSAEQQGYINPKLLPIGETNIGEFHQDYLDLVEQFNQYKIDQNIIVVNLQNQLNELKHKNNKLESRLRDLEGFQLD